MNTALKTRGLDFREEVWEALSANPKKISPKFLYDEEGSRLFEAICEVEAYYVTRAENEILSRSGRRIAELVGPGAAIIEPGAGAGEKVGMILPHLRSPVAYVPIEISSSALEAATVQLRKKYALPIIPICADYTQALALPAEVEGANRRFVFFPGSTIGNFDPPEAVEFLVALRRLAGPGGILAIGADVKKEKKVLERAYDDPEGVTAAFNLNLLHRFNRELGANFRVSHFYHRAVYREDLGRVEMHLVSRVNQVVRVAGRAFRFREGEIFHTESSYKYSPADFTALARRAGLELVESFTSEMFGDYVFQPRRIS